MPTSSGVETMTERECWRALGLTDVGRLVAVGPAGVDVFPVNYRIDARSIVFRSAPGTKLELLTGGADVAFQADGEDEPFRWSVVIHGRARRLDADDEIEASGILDLDPDAPGEMDNFVRVTARSISGRQFRPAPRA